MIIQFSAQIDGVTAKKDRTLSIKLGTQELSPDETSHIFEHAGKQIWVALAQTSLLREDLDIPEVVNDMDKKTPSKRLRDRMAVYYKETHGTFEGFDDWHKKTLESIGQKYLDKLN
jgi:hypothetical protein